MDKAVQTNRKKGYLLILIAAIIFSTTEIALKWLANVFTPMQLTVERVLIGGLVLLPFALREKKKRNIHFPASDWKYFLSLGFLTVLIHMSFLQLAVQHMDASAASAIYSGNPVFTFVFSYFILHTPIRRCHIVAIVIELIGILFIVNPPHLEISLQGLTEVMIATICVSLYGVLGKLRLNRLGSMLITSMNFLVGGSEMLLVLLLGKIPVIALFYRNIGLSLFAEVSLFAGFSIHSLIALLYVGIIVVGIGFLLTLKIVEYTSAVESSFVFLCKPIIATCFASLFLNEHISRNRLIGIFFFSVASLCITFSAFKELHLTSQNKKTDNAQKAEFNLLDDTTSNTE